MPSQPSAPDERPMPAASRPPAPAGTGLVPVARIPLESPFQEPGTAVTLLRPRGPVRRIVIALPVEKHNGTKYGSALEEISRLPTTLRDGTLFAAPTFSASPWLVNHSSRADQQQEDHFTQVVVPTVLATLGGEQPRPPVHLLGYSKGGFAALNLIARHPGVFTAVSVWDPSLLSDRPPHPQLVELAGDIARLDEYDVRSNLRRHAEPLRGGRRIALGGIGTLEADWTAGRRLLQRLDIPHRAYRDAPAEHRWSAAWLAPAMRHLLALESRLHPGPDAREG